MRVKNNIQKKGEYAIAIIADGETEKWYFQLLNEEENLKLPITYFHPKGSLMEVYEMVKEQCSRPFIKVYWVIDFDVVLKENRERTKGGMSTVALFKNILKDVQSEYKKFPNLYLFINNPCFEFWHLLHFKDTSRYYPMYEPELRKDLQGVLPNYEKSEKFYKSGKNIYVRLKPLQGEAIKHASKLPVFDIDNCECANAGIYELVQDLLSKKEE